MNAEVKRLPAPAGLVLDRDRPVGFSFESTRYRGLEGDTLASALAPSGPAPSYFIQKYPLATLTPTPN